MKRSIKTERSALIAQHSTFCLALCALLLALCISAEAQQPKKMARIGYLSAYSGPHPALAAFKEGLRELGWIEGKNITSEYRYGGGEGDKYSDFATELVRLKVDVIVAGPGNGAPRAAKRVTATIPIVMVAVIDPVRNGLVTNLARPGANITGITFEVTREQAGKNLELLGEVSPSVSRFSEILVFQPILITARKRREQPRCSESQSSLQKCRRATTKT